MRGLIAAVIGMGVLIVVGVTVLVVTMIGRMSATAPSNASLPAAALANREITLDEPPGTRIATQSLAGDRLSLGLTGGGVDRVVVLDLRTGRAVARAALSVP